MKRGTTNKNILLGPYKEEIIYSYKKGETIRNIASSYNVDPRTVSSFLKQFGINIKKPHPPKIYSVKEDIFQNIDTEEKAWMLGFIYADGYIDSSKTKLKFTLAEKDKDVLEKIKSILRSNSPIKRKEGRQIKGTDYFGSSTVTLMISNAQICQDLEKHGAFYKKSLKLQFPLFLKDELIRHFIRGYFDGDGSITFGRHDFPKISIASNKEFLEGIHDILLKENIISNIYASNRSKVNSLEINAKSSVEKFLNYIYKDSNIFMERKYQRYKYFFETGKMFEKY